MIPVTREEIERIIREAKAAGKDTTELEQALESGTIEKLSQDRWIYFSTGPPVSEKDFE